MTYREPIVLIVRRQILETVQVLPPTWQYIISSAIHFVELLEVSIHNGGGVGWGEVINGGFGMMIDGSEESEQKKTYKLQDWDKQWGCKKSMGEK